LSNITTKLSGANVDLYIYIYNTLLKDANESLKKEEDICQVCGYFVDQWNFIESIAENRKVRKVLASPSLLCDSFIRNNIQILDLFKAPITQKEVIVNCFRKFFLLRKYAARLLGTSINSDIKLLSEIRSELTFNNTLIKGFFKNTSPGIDCFEYKEEVLYARILIEQTDELLIVKPSYGREGITGELLYAIRFSDLVTSISKSDKRRILLETSNGVIELVFEDKEKAIEVNNKIKDNKKKSGESQLEKVKTYLETCKLQVFNHCSSCNYS